MFSRPAHQTSGGKQTHAQTHSPPVPFSSARGAAAASGKGTPPFAPASVALSSSPATHSALSARSPSFTPSKPPLHAVAGAGAGGAAVATTTTRTSPVFVTSPKGSAAAVVPPIVVLSPTGAATAAAATTAGNKSTAGPSASPPPSGHSSGAPSPRASPPESPSLKPPRTSFKLPQSAGSLFALSPLLAPSQAPGSSMTLPAPLSLQQHGSGHNSAAASPRGSFSAHHSRPDMAPLTLLNSRAALAAQTNNNLPTPPSASNSAPAGATTGSPLLAALHAPGPLRRATSGEPTPTTFALNAGVSAGATGSGSGATSSARTSTFSSTRSSLLSSSPPTASPLSSPLASPSAKAGGKPSTGPPFTFTSTATSAARHIPIRGSNSNTAPASASHRSSSKLPSGSPPADGGGFMSSPPRHPGFRVGSASTSSVSPSLQQQLASVPRPALALSTLQVQTDAPAAKRAAPAAGAPAPKGGTTPQSPALLVNTPVTPLDDAASPGADDDSASNKSIALSTSSLGPQHLSIPQPVALQPEATSFDEFEVVSRIDTGNTCGVFLVEDKKSGRRAIFKPRDQEKERDTSKDKSGRPSDSGALTLAAHSTALTVSGDGGHVTVAGEVKQSVKNGLAWGESTRNEVAAYLLDHEHSAGVPTTRAAYVYVPSHPSSASAAKKSSASENVFVADEDEDEDADADDDRYGAGDDEENFSVTTSAALSGHRKPQKTEKVLTYGSLQDYVPNAGSAEDMGDSRFSVDSVHRIGVLDIRLCNLDRHQGNMLLTKQSTNANASSRGSAAPAAPYRLVPIDHGFVLPSYRDLSDVSFDWLNWKACKQPFSADVRDYVSRLDPLADATTLKSLGIRDDAILTMILSTLLLQQCVAQGLTLYDIGRLVQRRDEDDRAEPSTLESIVAKILALVSAGAVDSDSAAMDSVAVSPIANSGTEVVTATATAGVEIPGPPPLIRTPTERALVLYAPDTATVSATGTASLPADAKDVKVGLSPQSSGNSATTTPAGSTRSSQASSTATSVASAPVTPAPEPPKTSKPASAESGPDPESESDDPQQARLKRLLELTVQVMNDEVARLFPPVAAHGSGHSTLKQPATIQLSSSPAVGFMPPPPPPSISASAAVKVVASSPAVAIGFRKAVKA